jgi:hypothetical protein
MNRFNGRRGGTWKLPVLASFAGLLISWPAQALAQHDFDIQGGAGGGFFKIFCPPGEFWVGLRGRAGDVLDHVQLICAGFHTERTTIVTRKNWTIVPPKHNHGELIGGSGGGAPLRMECNDNRFVQGINFNTEFFDGGHLVAFITMTCEHHLFSGSDELKFGFNFPVGTGPQKQFCPEGMWAIGLKGRRGFFVDAIGLLCSEMPPSPF